MTTKPQWQDTTAYSQEDAKRGRQPDSWSIVYGNIRIIITRSHIRFPGEWVMHCRALQIDSRGLQLPADTPKEEAQLKAISVARRKSAMLTATLESLSKFFCGGEV